MRRQLYRIALFVLLLTAGTSFADFIEVSTSFGAETALRDQSTQLDWLHLNVSRSTSYNGMQTALLPGGSFYGWRYATPDELKQLFIDYDGSRDGYVRFNDALAIHFMNDLGGPTAIADNFSTGFHREAIYGLLDVRFNMGLESGHAQYGYIAIDNFFGATIDPSLHGSTVDWYASPYSGHWLVRQSTSDPVPEPASLVLMASGLLVIARFARRR